MDRYMLFHGEDFYPRGGMLDLQESSHNLEYLKTFLSKMDWDEWAHIYDCNVKKIILHSVNTKQVNSEGYTYSWVVFDE
jgi:hypothetical protein